jgi:hypothetical protein
MKPALCPFVYDDGGRQAAGYRGAAGDYVCRAIAIAAGLNYEQVYDDLNRCGSLKRRSRLRSQKSSSRDGVYISTQRRYLQFLGWVWTPTMSIGSGCRVHLRVGELPSGRLIVSVLRHLTAVIDGVIHDTHDPSRDDTRCVYG